jgi:hypothetical protein
LLDAGRGQLGSDAPVEIIPKDLCHMEVVFPGRRGTRGKKDLLV